MMEDELAVYHLSRNSHNGNGNGHVGANGNGHVGANGNGHVSTNGNGHH
jgi:hypothetical protein